MIEDTRHWMDVEFRIGKGSPSNGKDGTDGVSTPNSVLA